MKYEIRRMRRAGKLTTCPNEHLTRPGKVPNFDRLMGDSFTITTRFAALFCSKLFAEMLAVSSNVEKLKLVS